MTTATHPKTYTVPQLCTLTEFSQAAATLQTE